MSCIALVPEEDKIFGQRRWRPKDKESGSLIFWTSVLSQKNCHPPGCMNSCNFTHQSRLDSEWPNSHCGSKPLASRLILISNLWQFPTNRLNMLVLFSANSASDCQSKYGWNDASSFVVNILLLPINFFFYKLIQTIFPLLSLYS